jgi:hypothetical protein
MEIPRRQRLSTHNTPGNAEPQLGERAPAGHNPSRHGYETTTQRPSRHCSWARRSRLSSLAIRPHPSRQRPRIHGHESGQLDTPSQTPHCAVGPAIKVGGSPLHTPSWGSAFPGTPSPSSACALLQATPLQDTDTKQLRSGPAATVAGHVSPGFHHWPSGHTPQDNGRESMDTNPVSWTPHLRHPIALSAQQ